jgi:hypothetical protein
MPLYKINTTRYNEDTVFIAFLVFWKGKRGD